MVTTFQGLKSQGYGIAEDAESVLGPVQFNQGFGASPVLMNAQQSDNPSSTPGENGSSGGQQDQLPPSGTPPSQGAKAPQQVYDPDNRFEYDIDGGVLPKGVKPDYFSIDGQVYGQTRRGQIWKQTGDGQWTSVHESEAEGIRSKRGETPQHPTPPSTPDATENGSRGFDDLERLGAGGAAGYVAGRIAKKWLKRRFPHIPDSLLDAAEGGAGVAVGGAVEELLPKQERRQPGKQ